MTDPPRIYDPPRTPPSPRRELILAAVFSLIALVLLLMGRTTAGEVFVALALVANVAGLLIGGSSRPGSTAQTPPQGPQTPIAGR
jgi:hypothetical protein